MINKQRQKKTTRDKAQMKQTGGSMLYFLPFASANGFIKMQEFYKITMPSDPLQRTDEKRY
ncbi:MAG: hypothetical protein PHN68_08590 [Prolixibacteraceae bacterium]|jgi:hypothetical protein|nr:hypothetical protein [Prolixibacteraceae bacterium]